MNECEKEEPLHEGDSVPHPGDVSKKKRKKNDIAVRKRKKGVLKVDEEEEDGGGAEAEEAWPLQEAVGKGPAVREEDEVRQKKKSDDLWASFLSDVGSRPKEDTPASKEETTGLTIAPLRSETKASAPAKVTITKVFDFAGEEVRVNKVVSADSKEAKIYLKSQESKQEESGDEEEAPSPALPGTSAKRAAGMSSILGRMASKKQKMSTLEKSKMDWDAFKSEEGITEELAIHNRGREGYVERKNFLERVDHRQFEIEKAVRQSNTKD
ncbi:craniofacial development protein 1 isoform X2 [Clinocottus analis]